MSLTRKMLKAMGIEDEKIEQIIEAHTETVDGLKEDIKAYKADAERLPDVQKELDDYKAAQETKQIKQAKETAYKALLKEAGVREARIAAVLKVTDMDELVLEDGKIKDADMRLERIKDEWKDFIVTTQVKGAQTANPPVNMQQRTITREEIRRMSPTEINQNYDAIKASLKGD